MLRVSLNEVYRNCQRALEASGAPVGVDREGAIAVAWLEARGLPGIATLARDLAALEGGFGPLAAGSEIDANGRSSIAYAGSVIDFLQSLAEPGKPKSLLLANPRSPLFLLPAAAARAALGERYLVEWPIGDIPECEALLDQAGATIRLARDNHDRAGMVRLTVDPTNGMDVRANGTMLTPELLVGRVNDRLANGVSVDEGEWRAIGAVAARVLVPATSASRVRGAGGGDANE